MTVTMLGGAFLAGVLSFVSPCVLPLLPTFSLILAQNSKQDGGEARRLYANTGPVLGTILLYAGDTATVGAGALLLFVYSLGFAVPFFLLAVIWRRHIVKLRAFYQYLPKIQRAAGVVLILLGILLWSDSLTRIVRILS